MAETRSFVRTLSLLGFLFGAAGWGCSFDFDRSEKTLCSSDGDCLSGRVCVQGRCVAKGEVDEVDEVDEGVEFDDDEAIVELDEVDEADEDSDSSELDTAELDEAPDEQEDIGPDADGDGLPDVIDNCPLDYNPSQEDFDHDGVGDLCMLDERSALVITEMMADPEMGTDVHAEWQLQYVELSNLGQTPLELQGVQVSSNGIVVRIDEPTSLGAGEHFVISGIPLSDAAGRSIRGYAHGNMAFRLAKTSSSMPYGQLRLERMLVDRPERPLLLDEVAFHGPALKGSSWQLSPTALVADFPALGNNFAEAWCVSWFALGPGRDGGTPGAPNGLCYDPATLSCDATPTSIPLNQWLFGDTSDPRAPAVGVNECDTVESVNALARELNHRVRTAHRAEVNVRLHPLPEMSGDQEQGQAIARPWLAMLYWREDRCPTKAPPPFVASFCLPASEQPVSTPLMILEVGTEYVFTVDGQRRSLLSPFEEGRFVFGVFENL